MRLVLYSLRTAVLAGGMRDVAKTLNILCRSGPWIRFRLICVVAAVLEASWCANTLRMLKSAPYQKLTLYANPCSAIDND